MKSQNKTDNTKQNSKKRTVITIAAASVALVALLLAIVLPIVKINADFDGIFDKMSQVSDPEVMITDMGAENVFGSSQGEIRVTSPDLVSELRRLAEDFKYKGKDSDSMGAWDIRFRVKNADGWLEVYLDEDQIYYVSGGVYYRFVPKNEDVSASYGDYLANIKKLLEKSA